MYAVWWVAIDEMNINMHIAYCIYTNTIIYIHVQQLHLWKMNVICIVDGRLIEYKLPNSHTNDRRCSSTAIVWQLDSSALAYWLNRFDSNSDIPKLWWRRYLNITHKIILMAIEFLCSTNGQSSTKLLLIAPKNFYKTNQISLFWTFQYWKKSKYLCLDGGFRERKH